MTGSGVGIPSCTARRGIKRSQVTALESSPGKFVVALMVEVVRTQAQGGCTIAKH